MYTEVLPYAEPLALSFFEARSLLQAAEEKNIWERKGLGGLQRFGVSGLRGFEVFIGVRGLRVFGSGKGSCL